MASSALPLVGHRFCFVEVLVMVVLLLLLVSRMQHHRMRRANEVAGALEEVLDQQRW